MLWYFLCLFFFFFFFFFFFSVASFTLWKLISTRGRSKWIAYFYLETSNFKLAQKYSFHALAVLPVARNAKFRPMYPLLEGVTVHWFGHSNKVLMNGRSKCLSGLVFSAQQGMLLISETKRNHMGQGLGNTWGEAKQLLFLSSKTP